MKTQLLREREEYKLNKDIEYVCLMLPECS